MKNDDGEFCIPGVGCWIECMEYNEGYKAHLSSPDTLVYPTSCPPCPPPFAKRNNFPGFANATHFGYLGKTGESYSIVISSIQGFEIGSGDEIGVFTAQGLCVGAAGWQGERMGLAAWQDDPQTEEIDGYRPGENIVFKLWDKSENREIDLTADYTRGKGTFGNESYAMVNLKAVGSVSSTPNLPMNLSLSQNYPNPFNPDCEIRYALPKDAEVTLSVYNVLGQKIKTLVDEFQAAGHKTVHWDGTDEDGNKVASGIYFYRIKAGDFTEAKKMILMK
ncbi:MAG: T9SS type A sorting domain-containing protein [candidate division Zixibacteria bacterium]|nr:T9SS type A sorting domain-containing protein [candidate division Zixibacteria bacterium]